MTSIIVGGRQNGASTGWSIYFCIQVFSVTAIIVRNQIYAGKYVTKIISSFGCILLACIIVGCSQICYSIGCRINFCIQGVLGSRNYGLFIISFTSEPVWCLFVWTLRLCHMMSSPHWSHWIIALLWDSLISNTSIPGRWLCWWWQPFCLAN